MADSQKKWDTDYEWKAVTLLGLGFGLVGLDRWIIAPLFPCMAAAGIGPGCGAAGLGLDYQAIGNLVGILGLVWGVFAIISGRLSDSIGHRKVLIPAILAVLADVGTFRHGDGHHEPHLRPRADGPDGRIVHARPASPRPPLRRIRRAAGSCRACSRAGSRCLASASARSSRRSSFRWCRRGAGCSGRSPSPASSWASCWPSCFVNRSTRRVARQSARPTRTPEAAGTDRCSRTRTSFSACWRCSARCRASSCSAACCRTTWSTT